MSTDPCGFPFLDPSVTDNGRLEQCAMTLPGIVRQQTQLELFAKNHGKVTVHGKRHSQGGQTLFSDAAAVDLDMLQGVSIDDASLQVDIDTGATWDRLHQALVDHPGQHLAPRTHQSSPYFSVGGSLAVNCHGRDPQQGPVAASVQQLTLLMADSSTRIVHRKSANPDDRDLFRLVLGGYGAAAIILKARLSLKHEHILALDSEVMDAPGEFARWVQKQADFASFKHFYAFLKCGSTADLFSTAVCMTGVALPEYESAYDDLQNDSLLTNDLLSVIYRKYRDIPLAERGRHWARLVQQIMALSPSPRRQLNAMRDTVRFMESVPPSDPKAELDLMQEYFIPPINLDSFLECAREQLGEAQKQQILTILTSTVRIVQPDDTSLLSYSAGGIRASVVINFKVRRCDAEQFANPNSGLTDCLRKMINLAIAYGGSYYLCYGRFASREQFDQAYPGAAKMRALRRKWDPGFKFTNRFLATYLGDQ